MISNPLSSTSNYITDGSEEYAQVTEKLQNEAKCIVEADHYYQTAKKIKTTLESPTPQNISAGILALGGYALSGVHPIEGIVRGKLIVHGVQKLLTSKCDEVINHACEQEKQFVKNTVAIIQDFQQKFPNRAFPDYEKEKGDLMVPSEEFTPYSDNGGSVGSSDSFNLNPYQWELGRKIWKKISHSPWTPRKLAIETTFKKMLKNTEKAIQEHRSGCSNDAAVYASLEEAALPSVDNLKIPSKQEPFTLKPMAASAEGKNTRHPNQDFHFYSAIPQGIIAGVLDGHAGHEVANYVNDTFDAHFSLALDEADGNVHQAMETTFYEINQNVLRRFSSGSTAGICFIDKDNRIYASTLADTEINIYRKINEQVKSIPFSPLRNWTYPKEALRAAKCYDLPQLAVEWPRRKDPKEVRFYGTNISRAFGDEGLLGTSQKPGIIGKPKIAINRLRKGDIVVICSDGLKDYIEGGEAAIVKQIELYRNDKTRDLAQNLVNCVTVKETHDDVTVIAIEVT